MPPSRRVEAAAQIRPVAAEDQPPAVPSPATIVDVTKHGLGLRVTPGMDVTPDRIVEIGVDGRWGRGRVLWSRQGIRDVIIAAIELTDPASPWDPEGPLLAE